MSNLRAIPVVLALTSCTSLAYSPGVEPAPPDEHDLEVTAALVNTDYTPPQTYCAAVWISPHLLLTARHCVSTKAVFVRTFGQTLVNGIVVRMSPDYDLALIETDASTPDHPSAEIAPTTPPVGEHLTVVGHPLGMTWSLTKGWVSHLDRGGLINWLRLNVPVAPGNSGGGAFDHAGRLIGICSRYPVNAPHLSLFVRLHDIGAFLRSSASLEI